MITWLHVALIALFAGLIIVLGFHLIFRRSSIPNTQDTIASLHQPFFDWADRPSLVTDVLENGWLRFSFAEIVSSSSVKSDGGNDQTNVEIGCEESGDSMQKIRLNPGLKKAITRIDSPMAARSVTRTALPLPGPRLGNRSFPQEAYFEIIVLPCTEDHEYGGGGGDDPVLVSVGLTGGGHLPLQTPGSFPGSIGFNSCGSVYLNGVKLGSKHKWGRAANVIGCGYNPAKKNVYFTANSQLVHLIHCKTEEFSHPLYPTLAANIDVIIVVNLGQIPFKFEPANSQRTPNPCFITRPPEHSPPIAYEDSMELFSVEIIESKWQQMSETRRNNTSVTALESDHETESEDLFELHTRE